MNKDQKKALAELYQTVKSIESTHNRLIRLLARLPVEKETLHRQIDALANRLKTVEANTP